MTHCTACGKISTQRPDGHGECASGHVDYNNPAPAVGVAIIRDGRILLGRRARNPKQGEWDLLGGFVEAGETVPDAARREIMEETGLKLHRLRRLHQAPGEYQAGQPTLNFVYRAEADGDPVANDDVSELRWFDLDDVPALAWPHEAEAIKRLKGSPR